MMLYDMWAFIDTSIGIWLSFSHGNVERRNASWLGLHVHKNWPSNWDLFSENAGILYNIFHSKHKHSIYRPYHYQRQKKPLCTYMATSRVYTSKWAFNEILWLKLSNGAPFYSLPRFKVCQFICKELQTLRSRFITGAWTLFQCCYIHCITEICTINK